MGNNLEDRAKRIKLSHERPIKSRHDLHEYGPPDPDAPERFETLNRYINRFGKEKAVVFLGHEAFEFSHYLISGMNRLFVNYFSNPDFVKKYAKKEYARHIILQD